MLELQIIEFYEANEHLWNTKHKDYKNKKLRQAKLQNLGEMVNLNGKSI